MDGLGCWVLGGRGNFESEINLKMDFKPDFLNLALVLV